MCARSNFLEYYTLREYYLFWKLITFITLHLKDNYCTFLHYIYMKVTLEVSTSFGLQNWVDVTQN